MGPESPYQRTDNGLQADQWSYNIPVPGGAIYAAQVSLLQGKISVPYTGTLSLLLVTGGNVTIPVQGVYQGTTYAPAVSHSLYQRPYEWLPHFVDLSRQSAGWLSALADCCETHTSMLLLRVARLQAHQSLEGA